MRPIDADALMEYAEEVGVPGHTERFLLADRIDQMPTLDVRPELWAVQEQQTPWNMETRMAIYYADRVCTACGEYVAKGWLYCCKCGAKFKPNV